jgi:hypothetical protein
VAFTVPFTTAAANGYTGSTTSSADTTGVNLLVLGVTYQTSAAPTISDNKGNTWTPGTVYTSGSYSARLWYCISPTVGTGHTFSATASGSYASIVALGASVTAGATITLDSQTGQTGNTANVTPSANNELIVAVNGQAAGSIAATGIGGSFTFDAAAPVSSGMFTAIALAHQIQPGTPLVTSTWTGATGSSIASLIIAFGATGGGTNTPLNGAAGAIAVTGSSAALRSGLPGSAGAIAVTGSSAALGLGEAGSAGAIAVTGSSAALGLGEAGSAGAITVTGSSALLTSGTSAQPGAITVTGSSARMDTRERTAPGAITVTGSSAELSTSSPATAGAITVTGSSAELVKGQPSAPGAIHVRGWPAMLIATSPPHPPAPGAARTYPSETAPPTRRPFQRLEVFGDLPPEIGSGPSVPKE